MTATPSIKPRVRDAAVTRKKILAAAKKEFARNGPGGARIDAIAERARINKRMINHYFVSKEALFQTALELAYVDIRTAEQRLDLDTLPRRRRWNVWCGSPGTTTCTTRSS